MPRACRVCADFGCVLIPEPGQARCLTHRRPIEQQRGTRQQRGQTSHYDAERKRWRPLVEAGGVMCWRCGRPLPASAPWDLGHDDDDRSIIRGPEHPACNRATAGRPGR